MKHSLRYKQLRKLCRSRSVSRLTDLEQNEQLRKDCLARKEAGMTDSDYENYLLREYGDSPWAEHLIAELIDTRNLRKAALALAQPGATTLQSESVIIQEQPGIEAWEDDGGATNGLCRNRTRAQ